jgi:hypothetical protein
LREDTTASSDIANTPFNRVRATMMAISKTSMDQGFRIGDLAAGGTDWRQKSRARGGSIDKRLINRPLINRPRGREGTVSGGSELLLIRSPAGKGAEELHRRCCSRHNVRCHAIRQAPIPEAHPGSPVTAAIGSPDKLDRKLVVPQTIMRLWSRDHHTVVPL